MTLRLKTDRQVLEALCQGTMPSDSTWTKMRSTVSTYARREKPSRSASKTTPCRSDLKRNAPAVVGSEQTARGFYLIARGSKNSMIGLIC